VNTLKKTFIECPYGCKDGDKPLMLTVSGSSMHVKVKHPDNYAEFRYNFAEHKKKGVVMDTATKALVIGGKEPPKVKDTEVDKIKDTGDKHKDIPEDKTTKVGDNKPPEGKSFLKELDTWLDSPDF